MTTVFTVSRHQRFEKAFLLAVDLEARDLFMVSGHKKNFFFFLSPKLFENIFQIDFSCQFDFIVFILMQMS